MIEKKLFGITEEGRPVFAYTMKNAAGMTVKISSFGGAIMEIRVPDREGRFANVVGGYDSFADYEKGDGYLGALIGRVGNRIAKGRYAIDGVEYTAYVNNGPNSLHGGKVGFSHKIWRAEPVDGEEPRLTLSYLSPDGEEGYPGNLSVRVTYTLRADNGLAIAYEATTDKKTIVNLTNHCYFNLGGYASGKVFDHVMRIDADRYLPTDENLIPTGELRPVDGTPFDFRVAKPIGRDFFADFEDLRMAGGYDHCFNFTGWKNCKSGGEVVLRGVACDPVSGRRMEMYTNQPCVQFYSANFLKNPCFPLRGGKPQQTQTAFCLETQTMPDSIHHQGDESFTDGVLRADEKYDYTTVYKFSAD